MDKQTRGRQRIKRRIARLKRYGLLALICFLLALGNCLPGLAQSSDALVQQAQRRYEAGEAEAAIQLLERALLDGTPLEQAVVQANLALAYGQTGQWQAANQAIAASRQLLSTDSDPAVLAQVLTVQGRIQLAQGQAEPALNSWQQAEALYQQIGDSTGMQQSQLNQAQALQALGLHRRALTLLTDLNSQITNPALRPISLRSLGEALQTVGNLAQARQLLEQALEQTLQGASNPPQQAALQIALANQIRLEATRQLSLSGLTPASALELLANPAPNSTDLTAIALNQRRQEAARQFVQQLETALQGYRQTGSVQAQLQQIALLIELDRRSEAEALVQQVAPIVAAQPLSQTRLYQQLNLAQAQLQLALPALDLLKGTVAEAAALGDQRTQSFGLGLLGQSYEQQDWFQAVQTIQEALLLAQAIQAPDLAYRWQWQLGRLFKRQGQTEQAIAAYREATDSLQLLRRDLVAINRDLQFSFQAQVEPVYRELVDLLTADETVSQSQLAQARTAIEALQVAELENFFQEACLDPKLEIDRVVDRAKPAAAVFYTIVLPDRIEVILKLPNQELQRYRTSVTQTSVNATVDDLITQLKQPYLSQRSRQLSHQVYDWLIRPAQPLLQAAQIETLVFVLDGDLRNLPLSALYDGQQFLVQSYSLALAPGLKLADAASDRRLTVLAAGLSEARANFAPLNFVAQEIQTIQAETDGRVLFNQNFTQANLRQQLSRSDFAVVHIATHGQFSSNAADTFILAWDKPINITTLSQLLQTEAVRAAPVELLVLSACQTALGDRRAALGMAGVAVRAGARSTIASLWNLEDDSGAVLMAQFYREFTQAGHSKAEALRQAQLALLQNPQYSAPRFWAPYILLGNWL